MKKLLFLLLATPATLFFPGCEKEKDNNDDGTTKTKTELITTGSWSFDKAMSGGVDISSQVPACYKDNVVSFSTSLNGSVTNTVVCTPTDITPATFTWSFQSGETVLALSAPLFPGGTGNFTVEAITATSLVVSQNVIIPPSSTPTNVVFYYKH